MLFRSSLPSPGLARGRPRGGRTAGLGLLFSAALAGPGPGAAGGADYWTLTALLLRHSRRRPRAWAGGGGGKGRLLDLDCSSPPLLPPSPGLVRGWREGGGLLAVATDEHSHTPLQHHTHTHTTIPPPPPLILHLHNHTPRRHSQTPRIPGEMCFSPGGDGGAHPSNTESCFTSPY